MSDELEQRIAKAIDLNRDEQNRLRGKLFTLIEAVGMPRQQEEAVKRLVRNITYDGQADIEAALRG